MTISDVQQSVAVTPLRGYLVTVVGRSTTAHNLTAPPEELPGGISIEVDDSTVVLHIPITAPDGAAALATGRELADDFFRVLGSSHAPYRIDPQDKRDAIARTDATYIADGPVPPGDVAEGMVSEDGWAMLDPTGEARRAGKIARFRAVGVVSHPVTIDALRFAGRDRWEPRLRSGLSLFWAGQCSPDTQVRFVLSMAAFEVLAGRDVGTLLDEHLTQAQRRAVRRDVVKVLRGYDNLAKADIDRLVSRLMDAQLVGATARLTRYLNTLIPDGNGDLRGGVTEDEVQTWQRQRGTFLHDGPLDRRAIAVQQRLVTFVGEALRRELDQALAASEPSDVSPAAAEPIQSA